MDTAGHGGSFHPASCRGWVAGQPKGCFGNLTSTCNECCYIYIYIYIYIYVSITWMILTTAIDDDGIAIHFSIKLMIPTVIQALYKQ